jgi:hypothetical protein
MNRDNGSVVTWIISQGEKPSESLKAAQQRYRLCFRFSMRSYGVKEKDVPRDRSHAVPLMEVHRGRKIAFVNFLRFVASARFRSADSSATTRTKRINWIEHLHPGFNEGFSTR